MRFFSILLLIFGLTLVPTAFAQKQGAKTPVNTPDNPAERIYLDSEVHFDQVKKFARDKDGISISGTIQSFYPNGRLAWETQWVNGKLHGVTRGYYENRKLKEETTWINGKLNGPAKWYDQKGNLLRETIYENDKDLAAPDETQEKDTPTDQNNAPGDSSKAEDSKDEENTQSQQ
ncbi:MAG: hypothetical protein FWG59_06720 [Betaproteobacteria bacterium]|nr:hypothetical protein [Betaproteobacteria bacterium]